MTSQILTLLRLAVLLFSVVSSIGFAQVPSGLAGFVLVNATGGGEPVSALFGGKPVLREPGLPDGSRTSGIGVPSGTGVLDVVHKTLGNAQMSLDIAPGSTPVVVAYAKSDGFADASPGQSPKPKYKLALRVLAAKPDSAKGKFQLVFAADDKRASVTVDVNRSPMTLRPWISSLVDGPSISIKSKGEEIKASYQDKPTTWFVFLTVDSEGKLGAVSFPQVVYKW